MYICSIQAQYMCVVFRPNDYFTSGSEASETSSSTPPFKWEPEIGLLTCPKNADAKVRLIKQFLANEMAV